ncbi:MAG TPA: right-handed parallel beta-helix repeat-containing protein [Planctomycetota bacterium]|nr:right-handed parallel beta-helix repeat-containing protein [Planctomycetota bacterium]
MKIAAVGFLALVASCAVAPKRPLEPGVHLLREAIRIHVGGVYDFTGVTLEGSPEGTAPDAFAGTAIVIDGGRDITIRNARIRGFKVAIHARGVERLTIEGCDLSGNWRQRLNSTPEAEAEEDWLSGHQNDDNEWLRYGAALYLDRCPGAVISGNEGRNGQNGICVTRSDGCRIFDNDFSFNSGWGLAMYRSSRNVVSHNKFDWCIRGYSDGVYSRGQDSAGILVYEQSSDNVFAYNSATHGGDGFFLWAGHETLDKTGDGGCNRNLLYRNDFSHAAANGIEATFSVGNRFVENRLEECDHAMWAGYSSKTLIAGNYIARCANGISIEHGNVNTIEDNAFEENGLAINLWWDKDEDLFKTAYGKKRNLGSEDYEIVRNAFRGDKVAIRLRETHRVRIEENDVVSAGILIDSKASADVVCARNNLGDVEKPGSPVGSNWWKKPPSGMVSLESPVTPSSSKARVAPPAVDGKAFAFLKEGSLRGRKYILMDEWGPCDPSDPKAVEEQKRRGVNLAVNWTVRFHRWESTGAGKPPADWKAVADSEPLDSIKAEKLDFRWPGQPSEKVPADHFATIATTEVELEAGEYEIRTVSDDGIRVAVDGNVAIEDWTWHPPKSHAAKRTLAKGKHAIVVEHFEIDGYAQLRVVLRPAQAGR